MLLVSIRSDASGDRETAGYDCEVLVTLTSARFARIARARVAGHRRADGWRSLVRRVAREAVDEPSPGDAPRASARPGPRGRDAS